MTGFKFTAGMAVLAGLVGSAALAQNTLPPAAPAPGPTGASATASPASGQDRITFNVKNINVKDFLDMLFKGRNLSFVPDPNLETVAPLITANIVDVPFDIALRTVLNQN